MTDCPKYRVETLNERFYIFSLGLVVKTSKSNKQASQVCSTQTPLAQYLLLCLKFEVLMLKYYKSHIMSRGLSLFFIKGSTYLFKSILAAQKASFKRQKENRLLLKVWSFRIYTYCDWPAATSIKASLVSKLPLWKSLQKSRSYHILLLTAYL